MFLMFFNDSDICMHGVFNLNFADDKKLVSIVKSYDDARNFQSAINMFFQWCCDNGLEINRVKSKVITYTLKRKPIVYDYILDGESIQRCNSTKDLGIYMNSKMSFNAHFEYVSNKSRTTLNFVKRQRHYVDANALVILYKSLVRSNLEFASCIWSPSQITHKRTIESTQKQFVMFINGDLEHRAENDYVLSPYTERCIDHNLETLTRRRVNACALFIHSILTGKIISPTLRSRITFNFRPLKNNGLIFMQRNRTLCTSNSPFNYACKIFNLVSSFVDPTLPRDKFRNELLNLPDSILDSFVRL